MNEIQVSVVGWRCAGRPSACLRVTGADTQAFLQGQFTQELRSSARAPVAYGLWLNQKGKVLADSFVLRDGAEAAWVISFTSAAAVIRERLEGYVIADDVVIEDRTDAWQGVTIGGVEGAAWLARVAGTLPEAGEYGGDAETTGLWFRGRRGGAESWEWVRLREAVAWPEGLAEISSAQLERERVAAGVPAVPADIGPGDLPAEGGLEAVAISYTKGCYLGQEVMARLKAMGQVRRRLLRVAGAGAPPAVPGALLQGETRVGELRSAVEDGAGGWLGLAMLTTLRLVAGGRLALEPGGAASIRLIDTP